MKHRRILEGSQSPWERLCAEGFAPADDGFVLLVDDEQRLLAATPQWRERFRDWWHWPEGTAIADVTPAANARAAWRRWTELLDRALQSGGGRHRRITLRRGSRARITFTWVSRSLLDNGERIVGVVVAGRFGARGRKERSAGLSARFEFTDRAGQLFSLLVGRGRRAGEQGDFVEDLSLGGEALPGDAWCVGAKFPDALPVPWRPAGTRAVQRARETGAPVTLDLPAVDGSANWELTVTPLSRGSCNAVFRRTTQRAATQRLLLTCGEQVVRLEAELRRAQRLATQGMLAAAIGHEVNNCLGIALANACLFSEQHGAAFAAAARAIAPVIHAVQMAGRICERFHDLGGHARPMLAVIDLARTVQRSFDMLVRVVPRRLTLTVCTAGELLVRADPTHVEQMVVNLVLNARDATRDGTGAITLSIGRTEGRVVWHWFEVKDDGAGIPAAVQAKLFTAFFTTKRHKRGTGLGLVTVRRLAQAAGGDVQLTSTVGAGTTVRVMLPAAGA